jgi:hypothetical protein
LANNFYICCDEQLCVPSKVCQLETKHALGVSHIIILNFKKKFIAQELLLTMKRLHMYQQNHFL